MSTGTKYQWQRRPYSGFNLSNELELSSELKGISSSTGFSRSGTPADQANALASAKLLRRCAQGRRISLQRGVCS